MNTDKKYLVIVFFICVNLCASVAHSSALQSGTFTIPSTDVGTIVDLSGEWNFTPQNQSKEVRVPVPQMLSRISWWLDDSQDYKKWEDDRLKKLGFDTEKSDEGTYRAIINVPQLPKDRHVWIEFDGVAMRCKVSCNGKLLGEHAGMFSRFGFDLTPALKAGENVLSIWVSMEKVPKTTAQLGEAVTVNLSAAKVVSMSKGMFGPLTPNQDNRAYDLYGIWQPVRLVVRGSAKINDVFFRSDAEFQKSSVQVEIASTPGEQYDVAAKYTEVGSQPGTGEIAERFTSKGTDTIVLGPVHGESVHVQQWTPADPKLYRLDVTLKDAAGNLVDAWSQQVGFRTFEIRGNQFYLNGHPYWLRGANQAPYGKNPWDPSLARKTIQFMHDGNERFTRTHATPWNEAWLDAADEIGLAVSVEGIRPWAFAGKPTGGGKAIMPPPAIFQHWLMENADVVKRCRNHPSVFIFDVGNEMLLRDNKNLDKWKMLSEVVKETRQFAPGYPIVCSSDYTRDPEFYESTLKPAGIDDGDIDDMHRYNGWYAASNFVADSKFEKEAKNNQGKRPLIGEEFSTGYPDLDTGLPALRYTRDLLTPQAWVGVYAYPGHDPMIWLTHHAIVTKRWAEQLRYQRGHTTAGFALFSSECWYSHSYDPARMKPYPVYDAVKFAWAPIGLALESPQRRFYGGRISKLNIAVTNDDEQFRDLSNLKLSAELYDANTKRISATIAEADIPSLAYYASISLPMEFKFPAVAARTHDILRLVLRSNDNTISTTEDAIDVFPPAAAPASAPSNVIIIAKGQPLAGLAQSGAIRAKIEAGATAIVFSPSKEIVTLFPKDLLDVKGDAAKPEFVEFADWQPAAGTRLTQNLEPMDLKWWARKNDDRAFIASTSHRLAPGGSARVLLRFIPPHGYIAADKLPLQYRSVMSEIPLGKGRLWICDLDLDACAGVDPIADIFAANLYAAAADPNSTKKLPPLLTHEQLLQAKP